MIQSIRVAFLCFVCFTGLAVSQQQTLFLKIQPSPDDPTKPFVVELGKTYHFTATAYQVTDPNTPPKEVNIEKLAWSVDPAAFGVITENGDFRATGAANGVFLQEGNIRARATIGSAVAETKITVVLGTPGQNVANFTISGTVVDGNNAPIKNASVLAKSVGLLTINIETHTDALGHYSAKVPAGVFTVRAAAAGFMTEYYDNVAGPDLATKLTLDSTNPSVDNINFELASGGKISGKVLSATDNNPVPETKVIAIQINGSNPPSTNTPSFSTGADREGNYTISGLAAGSYLVQAISKGYKVQFYNLKTDISTADRVDVTLNSTTGNIDFSLEKEVIVPPTLYRISGIVTDANHQPIADAVVQAGNELSMTPVLPGMIAKTDADGKYVISIMAGSHFVWVQAQGFVKEYYDNASTMNQAKQVTVNAGIPEVTDINFTLGKGGSISGTVVRESDGSPIVRASVTILGLGNPTNVPGQKGTIFGVGTDEHGNYLLTGLAAGEYEVMAQSEGYEVQFYDKTADQTLATKVSVTEDQTTTGIDFFLTGLPGISGTVLDATTNLPLAKAEVVADGPNGLRAMAHTNEHGEYTLMVKAGTYKIRATSMQYSPEWYNEQSDPALATDVVMNGTSITDINFTLEKWTGGISGTVYNESNVGVASAAVRVWSTPPMPGINTMHFFLNTKTNPDGSYSITGIPPGQYIVSAAGEGYITEYYNNVADIQQATKVTVNNGQIESGIDFSLSPGGSITGTITDAATAAPLADAYVNIRSKASLKELGARTDKDGKYTLSGLASGDYVLFAAAPRHIGEFYNDAKDVTNATPVSVTAPNASTGIDFALDVAPFRKSMNRTFSGRVIDRNTNAPLLQTIVESIDPATGASMMTTTNMEGRFEISAAENAVIRARAIGYVGSYAGDKRNWQESSNPNGASDIVLALDPQGEAGMASLQGNVTDAASKSAVANAWVYGADAEGNSFFTYTDTDGRFVLDGTSTGVIDVMISGVQYVATPGSGNVSGFSGNIEVSANRTNALAVSNPTVPTTLALAQNFPNPFNPSTTISFDVPVDGKVSLKVFNLVGQEIATLAAGFRSAGSYSVLWNSDKTPSGVYIYKLESAGGTAMRRMTLMK